MSILFLFVGLFIGGLVGMTVMCMLTIASKSDDHLENIERMMRKNEKNR